MFKIIKFFATIIVFALATELVAFLIIAIAGGIADPKDLYFWGMVGAFGGFAAASASAIVQREKEYVEEVMRRYEERGY